MSIIGFIVQGDRTSHGGSVLECSSRRFIDGLPVARLGDPVWCPRCKRATKIVSSRFPQVTDNGLPSAFDQDVTDCGAVLYSRHNEHAGYGSNDSAKRAVNAQSAAKDPAPGPRASAKAQEHFHVLDGATGKGIAGLKHTMKRSDGRAIEGETDEHGRTGVVWTDLPDYLDLELHANSVESDDPYHFPHPRNEED